MNALTLIDKIDSEYSRIKILNRQLNISYNEILRQLDKYLCKICHMYQFKIKYVNGIYTIVETGKDKDKKYGYKNKDIIFSIIYKIYNHQYIDNSNLDYWSKNTDPWGKMIYNFIRQVNLINYDISLRKEYINNLKDELNKEFGYSYDKNTKKL